MRSASGMFGGRRRLSRYTAPSSATPISATGRRPVGRARRVLLATGLALAGLVGGGLAAPASAAPAPTVVTITFDNQWANQMTAAASLRAHGMAGTFYIISGWIGLPGFMTMADLNQLVSWGDEIGGKTVNNAHLPTTVDAEAVREICTGRNVLMSYGFRVTNFAYPFAEFDPKHETMVKNCGMNSARAVGNLVDPPGVVNGCAAPDCPYAESIPPFDSYAIDTPSDGEVSTTLTQLQTQVTNAVNHGGGLLAFSFHQICDVSTSGCDPVYSVSPALFDSFLTWLQTQTANNVSVKTMAQVIGGPVQPAVPAPSPPPAAVGANALVNPTLVTASPFAGNRPNCFTSTGFGTNTANSSWSRVGGQGGGGQNTLRVSNYVSGDAKLVVNFDLGQCAPTTVAGHSYRMGLYYKSTAPVSFTVYGRNSVGVWSYWTASPTFPATSTWTLASWLTPATPATITALSYGMTLTSNGTLNTSNYSLVDIGAGPPPAAPVGVNALANPLLQTADGTATNPACWTKASFGTNSPAFAWTPTGGFAGGQETITMSGLVSGDAKLIPTMDAGNCAPTVTSGVKYSMSVYYKSSVPVFFTVYSRNTSGVWGYWTQSPNFPASSTWTLASFTTASVPATVNGMSIGMTIPSNGTLSTSNYSLVNTGVS